MGLIRHLSAIVIACCFASQSFADNIYRHIPFTVTLTAKDTLIVDYDFSQQNGITCRADDPNLKIDFFYKGRAKTANLPVMLESAHIPNQDHEELADISGQFIIMPTGEFTNKQTQVTCHYLFAN